jgi:hypothetical protein
LWAWSSALNGPYHFDDYVTPLGDPASQSLIAWGQHLTVTLRPVAKLSYALEAAAGWSDEPAPRRAVSMALHGTAAVLFLVLTLRLSPGTPLLAAAFLAALWFIHPVHADSVLMLSGRPAVLSGLFLLAALLSLERARPWLAASLFMLACLSRETALAGLLPLAVLAASRPGATFRSTLRELAPALLGGALVVAWILTTPRYLQLAEYSFLGQPFLSSLYAQIGAVPAGLGLLFSPSALSIDYGIPLPRSPLDPLFLLGGVLFLAAAVGIAVSLRRSRAAAVGLAMWLAALLPTQSIVPKLDALTNRPLSLAFAGLLLVVAPLLAATVWRVRRGSIPLGREHSEAEFLSPFRVSVSLAAMVLVGLLAGVTATRAALFRSELSLWQDAAAKSQTNERPHLKLAQLLKEQGRHEEAWSAVATAAMISPFSSDVALFVRAYRVPEVLP